MGSRCLQRFDLLRFQHPNHLAGLTHDQRAVGNDLALSDQGVGTDQTILADLGVTTIILMTNNPTKITGLSGYGLKVIERQSIKMNCNEKNHFYMQTKFQKMGHIMHD